MRLRSPRPLYKKRAKITPKEVDEWFANFEKFIQDVGVADRPGQLWNCDETGFDLQGRAGKVLGPASSKEQPYRVITGTKEHSRVALFQCNWAMHPSIYAFSLEMHSQPVQSTGGWSSRQLLLSD